MLWVLVIAARIQKSTCSQSYLSVAAEKLRETFIISGLQVLRLDN